MMTLLLTLALAFLLSCNSSKNIETGKKSCNQEKSFDITVSISAFDSSSGWQAQVIEGDEKNPTVVAINRGMNVKWEVDIFDKCGKPRIGETKIRHIEIKDNIVFVVYGKHSHASIDIKTGEVKCLGSD